MSTVPTEPGNPPQFIAELVDEVRSFLETARAFALHPIRSPRAWSEGRLPAMNPVAFFGAAFGLELGAEAIARHYFPDAFAGMPFFRTREDVRWFFDLVQSQLPLPLLLCFAALVHVQMRSGLRSTQVFRATLGVILFVDGLDAIANVLGFGLIAALRGVHLRAIDAPVRLLLFPVELIWAVLATAAVHGAGSWRKTISAVATSAIVVFLAVLFLVLLVRPPRTPRPATPASATTR